MKDSKKHTVIIEKFENELRAKKALEGFLPIAFAIFCCIDGEVHQEEIKEANRLGKKFLGEKFDSKEFEQSVKNMSYVLSTAGQEIFSKWESLIVEWISKIGIESKKERELVVALFCEVAFADGEVHQAEARMIDKISDALRVSGTFDISPDNSEVKNNLEGADEFLAASESFGFVAKLLVDTLIQTGEVPNHRKSECLAVATRAVIQDMESAANLLNYDKMLQVDGFLKLRETILLGLGIPSSDNANRQYSSTISANTNEELNEKKRAVRLFASLGLASIFGFLFCFGYAIYLFVSGTGDWLLFFIFGVILMVAQKWFGKKHDEITD